MNREDGLYATEQPSSGRRARTFMDGVKEIVNSIRLGGKEI